MGASINKREEIKPRPPEALNFFRFPSFIFMSITEESLPPYSAGIPPFIRFISFSASELNTEKNPNKCEAL